MPAATVHRNGNGKNPIQKPKVGVGRNPTLVPGNPGNSGGKPGRSGRKRLPFIERCNGLSDVEVLDAIESYLTKKGVDPTDPAWRWCAEKVMGYSKAEPKRALELGTKDDLPLRFKLDLGAASLARLHE